MLLRCGFSHTGIPYAMLGLDFIIEWMFRSIGGILILGLEKP